MREKILATQQCRKAYFEPVGDVEITVESGVTCELLFCGAGSGKTVATLKRDSVLAITCVEVGKCDLSRVLEVNLEGEGAECKVGSIIIASESQNKMIESVVRHSVPNCMSTQNFRAVATDFAVSHFKGLIYVEKGADGTSALQQSDNITLTDTATVNTDPQMLIYADDVKCNHGATVGRRDEDALFYMKQRGISEKDAQGLLLESFCYASLAIDNFSEEEVQRVKAEVKTAIENI